MRLFKSPEEKAAIAEKRAADAVARSPVGRAMSARESGDDLIQIARPVCDGSAKTISEIEAIGWRLEHVGYAYSISRASSSSWNGGGSVDVDGELIGVYLFRRT